MTSHYLLVSAITPALLMVWYFYARDLNKERARWLWLTFGLGVLSVIPLALFEHDVLFPLFTNTSSPYMKGFFEALVGAAAPEELAKFLILFLFATRIREFDEPMDGVVYGAVAALGFAALENVLFVFERSQQGFLIALVRALTAVPMHASTGALMGYFVGRGHFGQRRKALLWLSGLSIAIAIHTMYDAPILVVETLQKNGQLSLSVMKGLLLMAYSLLLVSIVCTFVVVRRSRRNQERLALAMTKTLTIGTGENTQTVASTTVVMVETQMASPRRWLNWVLLLSGGLLATAGGMVVLALASAALMGPQQLQWSAALVGAGVMGIPPLALGLFLFAKALKRMRKA